MRIAQALQMPLLDQGGVEVLVRTLLDGLPETDDILLVSKDAGERLHEAGISGRLAGHLRVPEGILPVSWNRDLLDWVSAMRIDLVHFHLSGTYGWKARSWKDCPITMLAETGTPVVCTNHQAVTFFDPGRPPSPLWRKLAGTLACWPGKTRQLRAVRWEACVSRHDLALTRKSFPLCRDKLIQLYHSRLDADLPVNEGPRSKSILNVATIAFRKGQHILADAFARIAPEFPDWHLDLVGTMAEASCVEAIESIRTRNHLEKRIRLHGPLQDPTDFYRNAGIYVQASLLEGLGLSLQEAMFHGVACIGSNCGGIPELLSDSSLGHLFKRGDTSSLAEALASLMNDGELRTRVGASARKSILARGMTRQAMCGNYRALYEKALEPK